MTKEQLLARLKARKMPGIMAAVEPHLKPSIGLKLLDGEEGDFAIGASRIGGRPDLPPNFVWPECSAGTDGDRDDEDDDDDDEDLDIDDDGDSGSAIVPLSFIAQINLREVSQADSAGLLPTQGLLYFFYTPHQDAWGDDPDEADKFAVRYYDGEVSALTRTDFPGDLPEEGRYEPVGIAPVAQTSWPSLENSVFESVKDTEIDKFLDSEWDTLSNKMLGYADPVQGEMELICEMVTTGKDFPSKARYKKKQQEAAQKWQLLLQVESSEERGWMLEDGGRLYFWIRKEDLAARNFDKCWFQVQSG